MSPSPAPTRTLSTAEERREAVIEAGMKVMAERGIHATPTLEVAKAAGISQAYLFRLFPTKADLAQAVIGRCNERIHSTFTAAAARAKASGEDVLHAMGESYGELIQDRTLLLLQLHSHAAAAQDPVIRGAMQDGFRNLYALIKAETGADDEQISSFFATGMLINTLAAMGAYEIDEPWAQHLCLTEPLDDPA
jgi:AcrR family transcriptional regulator